MTSLSSVPPIEWDYFESSTPIDFSLNAEYQTVLKVLGIPQLSMASMARSPKFTPNSTQAAPVVSSPTLWWCTSLHETFLIMKYPTLIPPNINTAVLALLTPPPHICLTNSGFTDTNTQVSCEFLGFLTWLGGIHSVPLKDPLQVPSEPCRGMHLHQLLPQ